MYAVWRHCFQATAKIAPSGLTPARWAETNPRPSSRGALVWTRQAAWLPGFVETLPATSQKQKRVVSPLGSHVYPKRKSRPRLLGGLKPALRPPSGVFAGGVKWRSYRARQTAYLPRRQKETPPSGGVWCCHHPLRQRRFLRWSLSAGRHAVRCCQFPDILCRCGSRRRSGQSRPARECRGPR